MTPDGVTLPTGVVEQNRRRGTVIPRPAGPAGAALRASPAGSGTTSAHELFIRLASAEPGSALWQAFATSWSAGTCRSSTSWYGASAAGASRSTTWSRWPRSA